MRARIATLLLAHVHTTCSRLTHLCAVLAVMLVCFGGTSAAERGWWSGFAASAPDNYVAAMTEYRGNLIVGGIFYSVGGDTLGTVVGWNGISWLPLGERTGGVIWAMTKYQDKLVVGGGINEVRFWDGVTWSAPAAGLTGSVHALTEFRGRLIAGGNLSLGGMPLHLAQWDGQSWSPLAEGVDGEIWALAVYNGDLIAGGYFTHAGGESANYVARWDGSEWHSLGVGGNDYVRCLAVWGGRLVVGGRFTEAGGKLAARIALWDGTSWTNVGNGFDDDVRALMPYGRDLIAGGDFVHSGSEPVSHVAQWHAGSWTGLGSGVNHMVFSLATYNVQSPGSQSPRPHLYVGGRFSTAGGIPSPYIARWDGLAGMSRDLEVTLNTPLPNPSFAGRGASFGFELPGPMTVRLVVYDVAGRQVVARSPESFSRGGTHRIDWAPSLSASGVYYVRLLTDAGQSVSTPWVVVQ